jgi:hypothetical protein
VISPSPFLAKDVMPRTVTYATRSTAIASTDKVGYTGVIGPPQNVEL